MGRCLPSHDVVFVFCNFDVLRGNARKFRNKIYRIKLMGWGMGSDVGSIRLVYARDLDQHLLIFNYIYATRFDLTLIIFISLSPLFVITLNNIDLVV